MYIATMDVSDCFIVQKAYEFARFLCTADKTFNSTSLICPVTHTE